MRAPLGEKARSAGYRLISYDTIGSTNSEALDRARAGDAGLLWIVSDEQTAGRGRRGRRWATPKGNLAASLLMLVEGEAIKDAATLGFVAGLALHKALDNLAPTASVSLALDGGNDSGPVPLRFELKWPNDVVAGKAKLAGIMLESERLADGRLALVIGIGVNVAMAPDGLPYPVASLAALGIGTDAGGLFKELAENWVDLAAIWDEGRGMDEIRRQWLERAAGVGAAIAARVGDRAFQGTFETIDSTGRLVIRLGDGAIETIAAAEVHFGAVASASAEG